MIHQPKITMVLGTPLFSIEKDTFPLRLLERSSLEHDHSVRTSKNPIDGQVPPQIGQKKLCCQIVSEEPKRRQSLVQGSSDFQTFGWRWWVRTNDETRLFQSPAVPSEICLTSHVRLFLYMIWYDMILFYLFMFVSISQNGMTPSSLDICGSWHPGDSRCTGFQRTGGRVR